MSKQYIMHIAICCSESPYSMHARARRMPRVFARWLAGRVVVVHSEQMASALKAFSYASCKVAQKSEHFAFIINSYACMPFEMSWIPCLI